MQETTRRSVRELQGGKRYFFWAANFASKRDFKQIVQFGAALLGELHFRAIAIELDGVADVVHDHLTRVAVFEVGAELIAHARCEVAVHDIR